MRRPGKPLNTHTMASSQETVSRFTSQSVTKKLTERCSKPSKFNLGCVTGAPSETVLSGPGLPVIHFTLKAAPCENESHPDNLLLAKRKQPKQWDITSVAWSTGLADCSHLPLHSASPAAALEGLQWGGANSSKEGTAVGQATGTNFCQQPRGLGRAFFLVWASTCCWPAWSPHRCLWDMEAEHSVMPWNHEIRNLCCGVICYEVLDNKCLQLRLISVFPVCSASQHRLAIAVVSLWMSPGGHTLTAHNTISHEFFFFLECMFTMVLSFAH